MKTAGLAEIKKEIQNIPEKELRELLLSVARYKKENKELLSYLLFDSQDEMSYLEEIKYDIKDMFELINRSNLYYTRKGLRKVQRNFEKYLKYTKIPESSIEIRIYFCQMMLENDIPMERSTAIKNIFFRQIQKIENTMDKVHTDFQLDFRDSIAELKKYL